MTNKNISGLTAATTPLAGTELVPAWDGATKKVAVDDLTVKNIRSNATSGILQIAGPAAASTRVVTVPNANWTAARTDAAQSFTDDQTLATGNLIQGTATKGINFTANTHAAGMTSQLLNWYEEGTWTPNQGAGLTVTGTFGSAGKYTRIGRQVHISGYVLGTTVAASAGTVITSNLPYASSWDTAGTYFNGTLAAGGSLDLVSTNIYAVGAISTTNAIYFSGTYSI